VLSRLKYDDNKIQDIIEENTRLKHAIEELTILNDLARAIGALNDSEEIMQIILHRSLEAIDGEQGVITLVDTDTVDSMKTFIRKIVRSGEHHPFHLHQSLLGWMHINKKPLLMNNPQKDPRFKGLQWDKDIASLLCVPLMAKSKLIGILTIYNKKTDAKFTDGDQRLLTIIGAQSAQVLENARLYEEEQTLLLMQRELEVAANIQKVLLPSKAPAVDGYDIAGRNITAQLVGGDYFDFIPIDHKRLAISIGDVSGKGLSAALLMANLQATLRSQALAASSAKQCIERSNYMLLNCTESDRFATCFYGILDHPEHSLTYCNAGHDPPILLKRDLIPLKAENLILGTFEGIPYTEQKVQIDIGDVLVMYSDGVTESKNKDDEEFGEKRLHDIVIANRSSPAQAILDTIVNAVCCFGGGCPQMDDITVVVVKRVE